MRKTKAFQFIAALYCIYIFLVFVSRLEMLTSDDTFVYFNYARNLAAGNAFCYDSRQIPSEGFTSLLYLLFLAFFEYQGVDLMFAAVALNLSAVLLILFFAAKLCAAETSLGRDYVALFVCVFATLILTDRNTAAVIGFGLETMLGPASVFCSLLLLFHSCKGTEAKRKVYLRLFFLSLFVAYLVRPENVVFLGACAGILVFYSRQRKVVVLHFIGFLVLLAGYLLIKRLVIGDFVPTGYYRKATAPNPDGQLYVKNMLLSYKYYFLVLFLFSLGPTAVFLRRARCHILTRLPPSVLSMGGVAVLTCLFFGRTRILIGMGYRYLFNSIIITHFLIALFGVLTFRLMLAFALRYCRPMRVGDAKTFSRLVYLNGFGVFIILVIPYLCHLETLDLHARARASINQHLYVKLGAYLRGQIKDIEDVTLIFGDAGGIPYASGCRLIDANGLTEPFIARLFGEQDGPEKVKRFTTYVLDWQPDLVVLGYGTVYNGWNMVGRNNHSPFNSEYPIGVYREYYKYGFRYLCSIRSYSDLHLGLSAHSGFQEELAEALLRYVGQGKNGYILSNGLTVFNSQGAVYFPPCALPPGLVRKVSGDLFGDGEG